MKKNYTDFSKRKFLGWGVLVIVLMTFNLSVNAQPRNIAPTATVYTSAAAVGCTGGTNPCNVLNDGNLGTCGSQRMYLQINGPSTTIGAEFIEWQFPTVETFDSIIFHHADAINRVLQGAIVQYYDGNNWVTHDSFSNLPKQCVNRVGIRKLTTNRFRITLFEGTGNFNFRQIEVLEANTATDDIGVSEIVAPTVFCDSLQDIYVTIRNYGVNQVTTADVNWEVNGVSQGVYKFVGLLDTLDGNNPRDTTIKIGTYKFPGPVELKIYTSIPNGRADTNNYNDTIIKNIGPAMSGYYTVDRGFPASARNFITLKDMSDALNHRGVCGPTRVDVFAGVYDNDPIFLDKIPGASAQNHILIIGDSSKTIVQNDIAVTGKYAALTFNGTTNTHVKDFVFRSTATTASSSMGTSVVSFALDANHDTLSNSYTWVDPLLGNQNINNITFTGSNLRVANFTAIDNTAHHNVIQNNHIIGGGYGIRSHPDANNPILKVNNQIIDNVIDSIFYMGAKFDKEDSLVFTGNSINGLNNATNNIYGIFFENVTNFTISANFIWAKGYALQIRNLVPPTSLTKRPEISNNMLYSLRDHGAYLIYIDALDFWHNSINVRGAKEAFKVHSANNQPPVTNYDIRNNIFSSDSTVTFFTVADTSLFMKLDNNIYYNKKGDLFNVGGVAYSDLATFQAASVPLNAASIQNDPQFVSATDLHISGFIPFDRGDSSVGITVDIDGNTRPYVGTGVDIGADEFLPQCPSPAEIFIDSSALGFNEAIIRWAGWSPTDEFQYTIIPLNGNLGTATVINTIADSALITGLNSNTLYEFYVRTTCSRGDTSVWGGPIVFSTKSKVPYYEDFDDFDNNLNALLPWPKGWVNYRQSVNDSQWSTSNSTTSAAATGPERDHTQGNSSGRYVWAAGSSRAVNPIDLISPPIYVDSSQSALSLSFWYFFHGRGINKLEIVIDTNGVDNVVYTIQGEHQTTKQAAWLQDSVSIFGYQGKDIKVKLRAHTLATLLPPNCCFGDMAIDGIRIEPLPGLDASIASLTAPIKDTTACYSNAEDVIVEVFNSGSDSIDFTVDPATVEARISGVISNYFSTVINTNALNNGVPLASGQSILVNLGSIDMSYEGTYYFDANVNIIGDANSSNDNWNDSIVVTHSGGVISGIDTLCAGDSVELSTANPYGAIQWQTHDGIDWVDVPNATKSELVVAPTVTTDYRVSSCGDTASYSAVFTVTVVDLSLVSGLGDTAIVACGSEGTAEIILSRRYNDSYFAWFDAEVGGNQIFTDGKYYVSIDGDTLQYTDMANASSPSFETLWVQELALQNPNSASLLITEVAMDNSNAFEIQNVSRRNINVDGWKIILSNDSRNLNAINPTVMTLSGAWNPNEIRFWEDVSGPNYWGSPISWKADEAGWMMILNDSNEVVDFVTWSTTEREIAELMITVNAQSIDTRRAWRGEGVEGITLIKIPGTSITRIGNSDNHDLRDFDFKTRNIGTQDAAFYTPFDDGSCSGPRTEAIVGVECLVGLQDLELTDNFNVYPNPSNGLINIVAKTTKAEQYNIYVLDAQGKLVFEKDLKINGTYQTQFNLSHLAKGMYYMRVQSANGVKTEKLIIQ